jgi:hypothetical protein
MSAPGSPDDKSSEFHRGRCDLPNPHSDQPAEQHIIAARRFGVVRPGEVQNA